MQVPDGFPGYSLPVPHPTDGNLYVKLRDDPSVINLTTLGAQVLAPTSDEAARAPERHAAHAEPEPAPTPAPATNGNSSQSGTAGASAGSGAQEGPTATPAAATPASADQPAAAAQVPVAQPAQGSRPAG